MSLKERVSLALTESPGQVFFRLAICLERLSRFEGEAPDSFGDCRHPSDREDARRYHPVRWFTRATSAIRVISQESCFGVDTGLAALRMRA